MDHPSDTTQINFYSTAGLIDKEERITFYYENTEEEKGFCEGFGNYDPNENLNRPNKLVFNYFDLAGYDNTEDEKGVLILLRKQTKSY